MLPLVGSTIVPPGFSFPSCSAASIIASPIRSLTLPPGFMNSSLASSVGSRSAPTRWSRTSGVLPTRSRMVGYSLGTYVAYSLVAEVPLAGEDHRRAGLLDRLDHLVVALRAARLDDRGDAGVERELRARPRTGRTRRTRARRRSGCGRARAPCRARSSPSRRGSAGRLRSRSSGGPWRARSRSRTRASPRARRRAGRPRSSRPARGSWGPPSARGRPARRRCPGRACRRARA